MEESRFASMPPPRRRSPHPPAPSPIRTPIPPGRGGEQTGKNRADDRRDADPAGFVSRRRAAADRGAERVLRPHADRLWLRMAGSGSSLEAVGDTQVDLHHTVEDVGIAFGEALAGGAGGAARDRPLRPCLRAARRGAGAGRGRPLGARLVRVLGASRGGGRLGDGGVPAHPGGRLFPGRGRPRTADAPPGYPRLPATATMPPRLLQGSGPGPPPGGGSARCSRPTCRAPRGRCPHEPPRRHSTPESATWATSCAPWSGSAAGAEITARPGAGGGGDAACCCPASGPSRRPARPCAVRWRRLFAWLWTVAPGCSASASASSSSSRLARSLEPWTASAFSPAG